MQRLFFSAGVLRVPFARRRTRTGSSPIQKHEGQSDIHFYFFTTHKGCWDSSIPAAPIHVSLTSQTTVENRSFSFGAHGKGSQRRRTRTLTSSEAGADDE